MAATEGKRDGRRSRTRRAKGVRELPVVRGMAVKPNRLLTVLDIPRRKAPSAYFSIAN
jgi:hypothetical protein